jgi:hypothetical protein
VKKKPRTCKFIASYNNSGVVKIERRRKEKREIGEVTSRANLVSMQSYH